MNSENVSLATFRIKCNEHIAHLRKIQIASLFTIVISLTLFFFFPYTRFLAFVGVIGEFYAFLKIKKIRCYQCSHSLAYLFLDPNYSKTRTSLIFPKELPKDVKICPYCQADFDKINSDVGI
jgi:hypothetical protein